MQLQNQFITLQELTNNHFKLLLTTFQSTQKQAHEASFSILTKITSQLSAGKYHIAQQSRDADSLLDQCLFTEHQKRLEINKQKQAERQAINQLLYGHNKNKINEQSQKLSNRLLSLTQHHKFIKEIKKQSSLRHQSRLQREDKILRRREEEQEAQRKSAEARRLESIEKKREAIKENLRKMRENHEKMILSEQQSRTLFNKLRQKKRLYQEMKQLHEQKSFESQKEAEKRLKQIREASKLDINQLSIHEREYMESRKLKNNPENSSSKAKQSTHSEKDYHPPPHSLKIARFLQEEVSKSNKYDLQKKKLQEKLKKVAQYSELLKVKYKPRSQVSRTTITDHDKSVNSDSLNVRDKKDRVKLGNEYLQQAKQNLRRRAKTEEQFNSEREEVRQVRVRREREKPCVTTLQYIPQTKRRAHIEKMKRQELEKLLSEDCKNVGDRLQSLRIADERISIELKRREEEMKTRYNGEENDSALALLLGTIKAKISLLETNGP